MKFISLIIVAIVATTVSSKPVAQNEAQLRDFSDADKGVMDFLSTVLTGAVQANIDDINYLVQNWASLGAHLLAGLSITGLSGGKREFNEEELKGFFSDLVNVILEPADYLVQSLSLMGAQVLAGIAMNGLTGKRAFDLWAAISPNLQITTEDIWNAFNNILLGLSGKRMDLSLSSSWFELENVVLTFPPNSQINLENLWTELNNILLGLGLSGKRAFDLMNALATNLQIDLQAIANALNNIFAAGKRELSEEELKGFFGDLVNVFLQPADYLVQSLSLMGAQVLAGVAMNGLSGKRAFDLWAALSPNIQITPEDIWNAFNNILLGLGKRELTEEELKGFFGDLVNVFLQPADYLVQSLSLMGAQVLAGVAMNGLSGKRAFDLWAALSPNIQITPEDVWSALNNILLGLGKRELTEEELKGFFGDLVNVFLQPADYLVQSLSLMGAQVLAGVAMNGLSGKRAFDLWAALAPNFQINPEDVWTALNNILYPEGMLDAWNALLAFGSTLAAGKRELNA